MTTYAIVVLLLIVGVLALLHRRGVAHERRRYDEIRRRERLRILLRREDPRK
jgi:hypothetical protein